MIAVIFEVEPRDGLRQDYLNIAAGLQPVLQATEGFISVERFQSLVNPDKILSLSFFEDEAAVERWRNTSKHRAAQTRGRSVVFADYRLRVAHVLRDYGMAARAEAPTDSRLLHGS